MGKILKRMQFNNGYGCSCCRNDWEETEWICEDEVPNLKEFFKTQLSVFDKNCGQGGCVGVTYEKNGIILFGVTADIYRIGWDFYAVKGDTDTPDEIKIPEVGRLSFNLDFVWDFYNYGS